MQAAPRQGAPDRCSYQFESFHLDPWRRRLSRRERIIHLTPKAFETLLVLVRHHGRPVDKDTLLSEVWPDTFVAEDSLTQNISTLRKALGDQRRNPRYILTLPGRGYQFIAPVVELPEDPARSSRGPGPLPEPHCEPAAAPEGGAAGRRREVMAGVRPWFDHMAPSGVLALTVCLALALVLATLERTRMETDPGDAGATGAIQFKELTILGNVIHSAISPDGGFLVYAKGDASAPGIYLRPLNSARELTLLEPSQFRVGRLSFSPDGRFIFFAGSRPGALAAGIYRIPVLGGRPLPVVADVDLLFTGTPANVSPDGSRIAFVRSVRNSREFLLLTAKVDGSDEKVVAARSLPKRLAKPAWSPDGKRLAFLDAIFPSDFGLSELSVDSGQEKPIGSQRWPYGLGEAVWLPDGKGLIVSAPATLGGPSQLWWVSYPEGRVWRITDDLDSYHTLSVTSEGVLVTQRVVSYSNLWILSHEDISRARRVTSGMVAKEGAQGLAWTADGAVLASVFVGNRWSLWKIHPATGEAVELFEDAGPATYPSVSPDGHAVVFVRRTGRLNIWRIDEDGLNPVQLTHGRRDLYPVFSADGRWVFFQRDDNGISRLYKVPSEGGDPVPVSRDVTGVRPVPSPDGRYLAFFYRRSGDLALALLPLAGGPIRVLASGIPPAATTLIPGLKWAPGGKHVAYVAESGGASNIWLQPVEGGSPRPLTRFSSGRIWAFDWSRDGSQLAVSRGEPMQSVVLISDFQPPQEAGFWVRMQEVLGALVPRGGSKR